MKKIIIFAVAVATLFAFSSCQKENLQDNESTNGVRIITAEFENNGTKTNPDSDGLTPKWEFGDKIMLLNNSDQQEIEIISGSGTPPDGKAYINGTGLKISTHLDNTLYAVYPASATTMTSCSGNITFTIPTLQDGTFASANICVAKSTADDETNEDNLVFSNATAVLKFEQLTSTGVLGIDIKATNAIAGQVSATFNTDGTINNLDINSLSSKTIYMASESAKAEYYVAVGTVTSGNTKIVYLKDKGTSSESKDSKELERNVIYSLGPMDGKSFDTSDKNGQRGILNGHEYVMIKAKYNGSTETYRKWALMNIGATKPEDFGHYFAWGYTDGCVRNSTNNGWVSVSDMTAKQFDKTTDFPNLDDTFFQDAATANWGGDWRMPTANEFKALFANCVWYSTENEQDKKFDQTSGAGYYVNAAQNDNDKGFAYMYYDGINRKWKKWNTTDLKFDDTLEQPSGTYDISTPLLFFLRAGAGAWNNFSGAGGYFWSKDSKDDNSAYVLNFGNTNLLVQGSAKASGLPIRPVSD